MYGVVAPPCTACCAPALFAGLLIIDRLSHSICWLLGAACWVCRAEYCDCRLVFVGSAALHCAAPACPHSWGGTAVV